MDAAEVGVALTPQKFGRVESADNKQEEYRAALDRLHHQVGHGPNIAFGDASGEVAVVDSEGEEQRNDRPEGNVTKNVAQANSGQREVLREGGGGSESLMDEGQASGHEGAHRQSLGGLKLLRLGSLPALRTRGERLDRHGE